MTERQAFGMEVSGRLTIGSAATYYFPSVPRLPGETCGCKRYPVEPWMPGMNWAVAVCAHHRATLTTYPRTYESGPFIFNLR